MKIIILKAFIIYFFIFTIQSTSSLEENYVSQEYKQNIQPLTATPKQQRTSKVIVNKLKTRHYKKYKFDDSLSSDLLNSYLNNIDPAKRYFSEIDISKFEKFRFVLDDQIKKGDLQSAYEIFNVYRIISINYLNDLINNLEQYINDLDFTIDEEIIIDSDKLSWQKNQQALSERNRRILKNTVLSLKLEDQSDDKIIETLTRRFKNQLTRIKQLNSDDVFQLFMNSLSELYDPHTNYFSPRNSENFNINMRLSLEGIGALLKQDGEYVQVERIINAGPADKQGELKPTDKIVSVSQNDIDFVEVVGWRLDEVVDLIRGKKGTTVTLGVISNSEANSNKVKKIKITRNTVKLEEQSAKKEILDIKYKNKTHKIGVISIPTFYMDFEAYSKGNKDYKSTTRDVKNLIHDLTKENVEAIIVDLRGNGGGSLPEVIQLTGLFVESGPVVQIRTSGGRIMPQNNYPNKNYYDKPLTVLIDRLSASASEIFAGAIQDYGRGLIIGGKSFGKGTVQQFAELDHGSLKITEAMFYRISGESTQHKGVTPDVILPSLYDNQDIGEDSFDNALLWDSVNGLRHKSYYDFSSIIPLLNINHKRRISENPEFKYLLDRIRVNNEYMDLTSVSLNESNRREFIENEERKRDEIKIIYEKNKSLITSRNKKQNKIDSYKIVSGDTLTKIAFKYKVTIAELIISNPSITNPDLIFSGNELKIPNPRKMSIENNTDDGNNKDGGIDNEIDFQLNEAALITLDSIDMLN